MSIIIFKFINVLLGCWSVFHAFREQLYLMGIQLSQILIKRSYPEKIIQIGLTKALDLNQNELRTCQQDQDQRLIKTFNPNNPNIFPVIKTDLQMLMSSPRMKSALSTIIHSRRQPPNLKQLLVNSKFTDKTEEIVSKCRGNKCYTCKQLKTENSFYFKSHDPALQSQTKYGL